MVPPCPAHHPENGTREKRRPVLGHQILGALLGDLFIHSQHIDKAPMMWEVLNLRFCRENRFECNPVLSLRYSHRIMGKTTHTYPRTCHMTYKDICQKKDPWDEINSHGLGSHFSSLGFSCIFRKNTIITGWLWRSGWEIILFRSCENCELLSSFSVSLPLPPLSLPSFQPLCFSPSCSFSFSLFSLCFGRSPTVHHWDILTISWTSFDH